MRHARSFLLAGGFGFLAVIPVGAQFHKVYGRSNQVGELTSVASTSMPGAIASGSFNDGSTQGVLLKIQRTGKLDSAIWQDLREEGQPAYVDRRVPEERTEDHVWPTLTASGREPAHDLEESTHRSKV